MSRYGNKETVFKIMNRLGVVKGNKETAKGAEMEAKHERDKKAGK